MLVCAFSPFLFFSSAIGVECETFYDIDSVGAPPFIAATINAKMKMISTKSSLSDISSFVLFQFNAWEREESERQRKSL